MATQQYKRSADDEATTHWRPCEVILTRYKNISGIIMPSLPDGEMATHGRAASPKEKQQGDRTVRGQTELHCPLLVSDWKSITFNVFNKIIRAYIDACF